MKECRRCGECCRYIKFEFDGTTDDAKDAAKWISFHHNCKAVMDNGKFRIKIWSPCRYLIFDRESSAYGCAVYEKRPEVCKMYFCQFMKGIE